MAALLQEFGGQELQELCEYLHEEEEEGDDEFSPQRQDF